MSAGIDTPPRARLGEPVKMAEAPAPATTRSLGMSSAIPVAAPFSFQKRRGKLKWREMAKIDLDRVSREVWPQPARARREIAH